MAIYRLTSNDPRLQLPKRVEVRAPNERRARLVASSQLGFLSVDQRVWIEPETVRCVEVTDSPFLKTGEVRLLIPRNTHH